MGLFKQTGYKKKIALLLLLTTFISMLPVSTSHEHPAEASVWSAVCPQGGSAEEVAVLGCSACGGSGIYWTKDYASDGRANSLKLGENFGLDKNTTTETDYRGTWTVYYRCYNCGECPRQSIVAKKVMLQSKAQSFPNGYVEDHDMTGPGTVPLRWCSTCGPTLRSTGEPYLGREASYGVYHIDMNITPEPVTPEVKKYTVSVSSTKGGYAYAEKSEYNPAETVYAHAEADDGYTFNGWTVSVDTGVIIPGFPANSTDPSFSMPHGNVTMIANFKKVNAPAATKVPAPTPSATVTPAPTSAPEPTPVAPSYPTESSSVTKIYDRYYTTSDGVTIAGIRKRDVKVKDDGYGYLASHQSERWYTFSEISHHCTYQIGTDTSGNEWYFIANGSSATYVHPKKYNGYEVDSSDIRYITELIFPGTVTSNGTKYTVRSIGGGTATYAGNNESYEWSQPDYSSGTGWLGWGESELNFYGIISSNSSYDYFYYNSYPYQSRSEGITQTYGVIGNGRIGSSGHDNYSYPQGVSDSKWYGNSYTVCNTTLQYVTIPDTVTEICESAFENCQALRKISGGKNVRTIGKSAFSGSGYLKTERSEVWTDPYGYGIVLGFHYYIYDGAYSFGSATPNMRTWERNMALSSYMELPEFPSLKIIEDFAFSKRKNLFDVKLPEGLQEVKESFTGCDLNSITIPGKDTVVGNTLTTSDYANLGTKGEGIEPADQTIIITVPESNALYYGLRNEEYYVLRAGYDVIYHRNGEPEETYPSVAMVEIIKKEIAQDVTVTFSDSWTNSSSGQWSADSKKFRLILDTDGMLWQYTDKDLFPTNPVPDARFIRLETGKDGEYSSDDSYSSSTENGYCFAYAEDGTIWFFAANRSSTAESWQKLDIPAGSKGHILLYHKMTVSGGSYSEYSDGYSYTNEEEVPCLYYLNKNGKLYRKKIGFRRESYGEAITLSAIAPEALPMPSGVSFASFYVNPTDLGRKSSYSENYSYESLYTKQYTLTLPRIYAMDTTGKGWGANVPEQYTKEQYHRTGESKISSSYGDYWEPINDKSQYYNETEFEKGELSLSKYRWEQVSGYRYIMQGSSKKAYWNDYSNPTKDICVIDAKGDLRYFRDVTVTASDTMIKGGTENLLLSGQNFVSAEQTLEEYYLLTDAKGGIWAYYNPCVPGEYSSKKTTYVYYKTPTVEHHKPVKIFDDAEIQHIWNASRVTRYSGDYSSDTSYYHNILIFDSKGRYWEVSTVNSRGGYDYGSSWESYDNWTATTVTQVSASAIDKTKYNMTPELFSTGYAFIDTLYDSMFTMEGEDFLSWNTAADGTGITYLPGDKVEVNAPLHLYAQWGQKSNIIHYFPNGGEGYMEKDVLDASLEKTVLKKNIFTKKGYAFVAWNTKADGTGTSYKDMELITVPKGSTSLYAQWRKIAAYTVQTAEDDVNVRPVVITSSKKLESEDTYTIPDALTSKFFRVSYELRKETTGTSTPTVTLTKENKEATFSFFGWMLYEKTGEDSYSFRMKRYLPGTIASHLATSEGATMVLFPYWSSEVSGVTLPVPDCNGYNFIGWGFSDSETNLNNLIRIDGEEAGTYKPTADTTLYAYWEPKDYILRLDDRGATTSGQGTVTMRYDTFGDKNGQGVLVPKKTGYTFQGYYTGTRGTGTMYFDGNGQGTQMWADTNGKKVTDIKTLYACWEQDEVQVPEKNPVHVPQLPENDRWEVEIYKDSSVVQMYADDYDSSTGALTDKQPYLVSDVVLDGKLEAAGAIPSTECVSLRAKMGAWMFSGVFERKSGTEEVRVKVTVPYRTQYENPEDESLVISEVQTATMEIMVPKAWSYWTLTEGGIYLPDRVVAVNDALEGGRAEVPVTADAKLYALQPSYEWKNYMDTGEALEWGTYDTDGTPISLISLTEPEYIISDIPGAEPDVTEHLANVCHNAAWNDGAQFTVKSDTVRINGISLLIETGAYAGTGAGPCPEAIDAIRETIPETTYPQAYQSGIPLLATAKNGRYETKAMLQYKLTEGSGEANHGNGEIHRNVTGNETTEKAGKMRQVVAGTVNEINIHTPVVCIPEFIANHEDMVQCQSVPQGSKALVLDEEGIHSEFVLHISNDGEHSEKLGYGRKSYTTYLAEKDGKEQNEVRFPFAVWVDVGNDTDNNNDVLLDAGIWYTLGCSAQRFYLPVWTKEGVYDIQVRSVAVNGRGEEEKTEEIRNTQPAHYVATDRISVFVTGRLYGFTVYEVGGRNAWEEVKETLYYTVGTHGPEYDEWNTLPLRQGVHPRYRNLGGLPMGGCLKFTLQSIGSLFENDATLTIYPYLFRVTENGYEEADVYFEENTANGIFLKRWKAEDKALSYVILPEEKTKETKENALRGNVIETTDKQYENRTESALQQWDGTFSLPLRLYVAEPGADVLGYQKIYGLSFSESFWLDNSTLLLRFAFQIKNAAGETLYYGMLPEEMGNNIWKREAGSSYRYDNKGNSYEIQGGEVAVIYPGDYTEKDYTVGGIY